MSLGHGQWFGNFSGTNSGTALLDLDSARDKLSGILYAFDDAYLFSLCCEISLSKSEPEQSINVKTFAFDGTGKIFSAKDISNAEFAFPENAQLEIRVIGNDISLDWSTDIGTYGTAILFRSKSEEKSDYVDERGETSWRQFQEIALSTDHESFIFRGQARPWRLRTSFHRTMRKDLVRYWHTDVPMVRHSAVDQTSFYYDPAIPDHNGAFMYLLQHHGYPTPMLDWTRSPYIAAFFAFYYCELSEDNAEKVRIFQFDEKAWISRYNQVLQITHCKPHFSLLQPPAIGNKRSLPQKSVAAMTNVDDIESYIATREQESGCPFLKVYDIPLAERTKVLRQLGLMGISPGSLFPGMEGLCREYRDRHFGF